MLEVELEVYTLNHIHRVMTDAEEVHGLKVATPAILGTAASAGMLVRLNGDGDLETGGALKIIGDVEITGGLTAGTVVGAGDVDIVFESTQGFGVMLDRNANQTGTRFFIRSNAGITDLFAVDEDGTVTINGNVNINGNLNQVDGYDIATQLSAITGALATLDLQAARIKVHPPQTMLGGETVITLPEPYQTGIHHLLVSSGGLIQSKGVHWEELSATQIEFTEPREAGEVVEIIEFQRGSDDQSTVVSQLDLFIATQPAAGVVDSTDGFNGNGTFTLAHDIDTGTVPRVFVAGTLELHPNEHFTWINNTITILPGQKPIVGEQVFVQYLWRN